MYGCAGGEFPAHADASRDGKSTAVRVDESGGRDGGEWPRASHAVCGSVLLPDCLH